MTDRKFSPPTEFPAEYVTSDGRKAVILGRMPNDACPYIGYVIMACGAREHCWNEEGLWDYGLGHDFDLHDLPKKQVRWMNDYGRFPGDLWCKTREEADEAAGRERIAVIRREWVEGQPPQYFVEEV